LILDTAVRPQLTHAEQVDRRTLLRAAGVGAVGFAAAACSSSGSAGALGASRSAARPAGHVTSRTTSFASKARGVRVTYTVLLPPGHATPSGLPVCLVLHGRGDDHRAAVALLHLDRTLEQVVDGGAPPFALVAVDGGTDNYWHLRRSGDDPQAMLRNELLPRLATEGFTTGRFGLFGWSMGAYGALLLAETVGRARVAFVAADSPALWLHPGDSAPGAFDDAEDFERHDVFAGRPRLAGIPVRVMCGQSDFFVAATRVFVKSVPDLVAADFPVGGHTPALWQATAAAQLTPLAHALG
jgi:S-formylglutathione hydrolase FrmB